MHISHIARVCRQIGSCLSLLVVYAASSSLQAAQIDIPGPAGSTSFGDSVKVLPNGNIVVVDFGGPVSNIGAVHLFSSNGSLISTLTGSSANDEIGSGGIVVLPGGDFLVVSPDWDNAVTSAIDAGAITWVGGNSGLSGQVSPANSLVGSTTNDRLGRIPFSSITVLSNGNYVVGAHFWDNGAIVDAGAVTWGDGSSGVSGSISQSNSLVGLVGADRVGSQVFALSNGNYVATSSTWDNGGVANAGAATWGNGSTGTVGVISPSNSLVGTQTDDLVGTGGVIALSNGHYVVSSFRWANDTVTNAGAATWGNGLGGTVGAVSTSNSLVGRGPSDGIGYDLRALSNGKYVVLSPFWGDGVLPELGAITIAAGDGPVVGQVTAANSFTGSSTEDRVGYQDTDTEIFAELANGHFVVLSNFWDNGATEDAGAATWFDSNFGASGTVTATNSLVGTSSGDRIGLGGLTALANGNYVVSSYRWDNGGTVDAGAVTWANGDGTTVGPVSIVNSLIGTSTGDLVGINSTVALANGNYVVRSSAWDNDTAIDAGAVTWGDGSIGISGEVSSLNSLVGTSAEDQIGYSLTGGGVLAAGNGNYVVGSQFWDDGAITDAGAVTWVDGSAGMTGSVTTANSLVGTTASDEVGRAILVFADGQFAIASPFWDNGAMVDAGAVTLADGDSPLAGTIIGSNSVLGGMDVGLFTRSIDYDETRQRLAVGRPAENLLSLLTLEPADRLFFNGFD